MRKIVVDDKEYEWKVGRVNVIIRHNRQKFAVIDIADLLNLTWDEIERARWKGYFAGVTPRVIADYIKRVNSF